MREWEKDPSHPLAHPSDGCKSRGAKNFFHVSHVSGRSPSIWAILHCFSKAISMELVHKWPAKVRKLWDAGISDGGFTHCTTLLHPRSISVCSCMYMLTIRIWLVVEEAEQPLSWISIRDSEKLVVKLESLRAGVSVVLIPAWVWKLGKKGSPAWEDCAPQLYWLGRN